MTEGQVSGVQKSSGANPVFEIEVAGISDVGRRRANNEDCFGYDLDERLFIVCDGIGGMAGGEVASSLAVERTIKVYSQLRGCSMLLEERLHAAIVAANLAVWSTARETPGLGGMGTTLVAACILDNLVVIGNVGDSRAYFLRDDGCVQITEDHSYQAARMRHQGSEIALAESVALRQYITRAVGAEGSVHPDYYVAELRSGDAILLATDGLTRYVDASRIGSEVRSRASAEEMCRGLIAMAHDGGAADNVTCVVIRFR
jgi:protein phosphatase